MNKTKNTHPLRALLIAQFFGAFNDNAWKLAVTFLSIRSIAPLFENSPELFQEASQLRTTITFSALMAPLILISIPAGALADRVSKRSLMIALKFVEVALMSGAALILWFDPGSVGALIGILALMGAQSALFSPAKYGILPEILPRAKLPSGNGLLEMWTFLAIIFGTVAGGAALDLAGSKLWIAPSIFALLAVVGFIASFGIPKVAPARSDGSILDAWRLAIEAMRADRILLSAALGTAAYWFVASLLGQDIVVYAKTALRLSDTLSGAPLAIFGIGVGLGSLMAGRISAGRIEYGLIPLGAIGATVSSALIGMLAPGIVGLGVGMFFLGCSSGAIIVPLHTILQWRSGSDRRGAVIAASNVLTFTLIFLGSICAAALAKVGLSAREIILFAATALSAFSIGAIRLCAGAFISLALRIAIRSLCRLKVHGASNIPPTGAVALVANHLSYLDGPIIIAASNRPIRFIIERKYYDKPFLKPFMKALGLIPISSDSSAVEMLRSLRQAGKGLDADEAICIFPEGKINRVGSLLPFQRGVERLTKNRNVPIIPVHLDGLTGTVFAAGGAERGFWRRFFPALSVTFGDPLAPSTPARLIWGKMLELSAIVGERGKKYARPLHHGFIRNSRAKPWRLAFLDGENNRFSAFRSLVVAIAIARRARGFWGADENIGIMAPPTPIAALVNIAASLGARASVNLNYLTGERDLEYVARRAGLNTIITSRKFLERVPIAEPTSSRFVYLEDIADQIGAAAKLEATLAALFFPIRMLEWFCASPGKRRVEPSDLAAILFTSGSASEPKGVELTHSNIAANIESVGRLMRLRSDDRLLGILPFFHALGYMSFWLAATNRITIAFHPNALDAISVGALVPKEKVTLLLATPTFLRLYERRVAPDRFGSLRLVLSGAEKLSADLARDFEDRFGLAPLEGYGMTECSPVIACSAPDHRALGSYQKGSRIGSVGRVAPGVAARIVDPDTRAPMAPGEPGLLQVRGANVMRGYFRRADLTERALQDGWFSTGDIASIDADGFLSIVDRLDRFAKIGGEMISLGRIEADLHGAVGASERIFCALTIPDNRKGETILIAHSYDPDRIGELIDKLKERQTPALAIPRAGNFVQMERIPLLGIGKPDLAAIRRYAMAKLEETRRRDGGADETRTRDLRRDRPAF